VEIVGDASLAQAYMDEASLSTQEMSNIDSERSVRDNSLVKIHDEGTSKINLNQKPNVTNEKLKNIINDLYKGQGGPICRQC